MYFGGVGAAYVSADGTLAEADRAPAAIEAGLLRAGTGLREVLSGVDPVALRELFSPGFLDWITTIDREVEFGVSDRQLWFLWRLRELTEAELTAALEHAGRFFTGVRDEMEESGVHTFPAGPWHAGLEPFPGHSG